MVSLETFDMAADPSWLVSETCSTDFVFVVAEPLLEGNLLFHENQYNMAEVRIQA